MLLSIHWTILTFTIYTKYASTIAFLMDEYILWDSYEVLYKYIYYNYYLIIHENIDKTLDLH